MARNRNKGENRYASNRGRVKKNAEEREKRGGNNWLYNLPEGTQKYVPKEVKGGININVIPYLVTMDANPEFDKGQLAHRRKIKVHFNLGLEGNEACICPTSNGKRCPRCEEVARLKKNYKENEDEIKLMRPQNREIYNFEIDGDMFFADISYANFGELLDEEIEAADDNDPICGIADLQDRPTLNVRWKKDKWEGNTFVRATKIDAEQGEDLNESVLDDVINLDEILIVPSYEEMEKLHLGLSGEDKDENNDSDMGDDVPMYEEKDHYPEEHGRRRRQSSDRDHDHDEKSSSKSEKRGRKEDPDEDDNQEDDDDRSSRNRKQNSHRDRRRDKEEQEEKTSKSSGKKDKNSPKSGDKCPFGHKFGVDTDNSKHQDDCDECNIYFDCDDVKKENND